MSHHSGPPAKRTRYNLRSNSAPSKSSNRRYNLRSNGPIIEEPMQEPISKRKKTLQSRKAFADAQNKKKYEKLTILDLSDDCLNYIFDYLNVKDVCAVSNVCNVMKNAAEYHFSQKYKNFKFNRYAPTEDVKNVLKCFGGVIESINLPEYVSPHNNSTFETLSKYVVKYCRENLNDLQLNEFSLASVMSHFKNLNSLKRLKLEHCESIVQGWEATSSGFAQLKELVLVESSDFLENGIILPVLEKFQLDCTYRTDQMFVLYEFIRNHKKLNTFLIESCRSISSHVFTVIAENMHNLHELEFNQPDGTAFNTPADFQRNILSLAELKELHKLKLHCNFQSITALMKRMSTNEIPIEHLHLSFGLIDTEMIDAIAKIKGLKVLKLNQMDNLRDEHLIKLAKELPQLKELHIKADRSISIKGIQEVVCHAGELSCLKLQLPIFKLNQRIYENILGYIKQRRGTAASLKMEIYGVGTPVLIPRGLIDANKRYLEIVERQEVYNHLFDDRYNFDSSSDEFSDDELELSAQEDFPDDSFSDDDSEMELE